MEEYVKRYVDLDGILDRRSVFLIGPRMCGKSMYAKNEVKKPVLYWNLLSNALYYRIVRNPALLEETLKAEGLTEGLVVIDEIQRDIDRINSRLSDIEMQIIPVQSALAMNDKALITLQKNLGIYQSIAEEEKKSREISGYIEENEKLYKENKEKITQFNAASRSAIKQTERIEEINKELTPLMHERDRLNHQMRLVDDYNRELYELNNQYNILETIRYYSSPTTGIQLVFMEMYMGKIIQVANDLLSMFFNGQFRIMPFIINETEFRIPCAGDGIINDDISSMSSAQIAMISMILSFSFLYSSNSRYNILKLDEIDGPLDSNNRIMFVDVLNSVMNMMGTEQCIMISHNTELQVEDADIILLKSSENNDYMHGNIIWKY